MLTPRIETVIAEKQGKVLLAKVDIDENTDLALDYHVSFVAQYECNSLVFVEIYFNINKLCAAYFINKVESFLNKNLLSLLLKKLIYMHAYFIKKIVYFIRNMHL